MCWDIPTPSDTYRAGMGPAAKFNENWGGENWMDRTGQQVLKGKNLEDLKGWETMYDTSWGGTSWMDRLGLGQVDDDDFTEDTTVTSDNGTTTIDDDIGFGQGVVGGSSDPSLKRRQRGSKNRLRKLMRKYLKIPTGRSVPSVKGVS